MKRSILFSALIFSTLLFVACGDDTVDTEDMPVAAFSLSGTVHSEGDTLQLTNSSTNATTYKWSIAPGDWTSTEENPAFELTMAGDYTVTLVATGDGGSDTATQTYSVGINKGYRAFGNGMKIWYVNHLKVSGLDVAQDPCYWDNTLTFKTADSSFVYAEGSNMCTEPVLPGQSGTFSPSADFSTLILNIQEPFVSGIAYDIVALSNDSVVASATVSGMPVEMTLKSTMRTQ